MANYLVTPKVMQNNRKQTLKLKDKADLVEGICFIVLIQFQFPLEGHKNHKNRSSVSYETFFVPN